MQKSDINKPAVAETVYNGAHNQKIASVWEIGMHDPSGGSTV